MDESSGISRKRCKIGGNLLLLTHRKWHTDSSLLPKSVTLNDLERRDGRYFALFNPVRYNFGRITSQRLKLDHTLCIRQKCSPKNQLFAVYGWWSGVVVSALASINEVNQRWARLVLRRVTVSGFNSRCRTFISVCNQPATQGQLSLPSLRGR